jgi:hypothetical protein
MMEYIVRAKHDSEDVKGERARKATSYTRATDKI